MSSPRKVALAPRFLAELERIIDKHNTAAHSRDGRPVRPASADTRLTRKNVLRLAFADLLRLGTKLRSPDDLRESHVRVLMRYWQTEMEVSISTLHTRLAVMRVFADWIGKARMLGKAKDYIAGDHRRRIAATDNGAWMAKGVDPAERIAQARALDERMALYLSLQDAFGLRVKESIEMRPLRAMTEDGNHLLVSEGTKGGRPRMVPIDTPHRREVIEWARKVAVGSRSKSLRWQDCTWRQAQRRYYWYAQRLGITRNQLGVTSHGLRHGDAQRAYRQITGLPTPVEGGAIGRIDAASHRYASMKVSQRLGHGRTDVVGFYYGSYGHALRTTAGSLTQRLAALT